MSTRRPPSWPKRADLWHQYVDLEIKFGQVDRSRKLLERMTSMKFSTKKMRAFFKKWLPTLVTAEKISCYALTEPGNGSENGRSVLHGCHSRKECRRVRLKVRLI